MQFSEWIVNRIIFEKWMWMWEKRTSSCAQRKAKSFPEIRKKRLFEMYKMMESTELDTLHVIYMIFTFFSSFHHVLMCMLHMNAHTLKINHFAFFSCRVLCSSSGWKMKKKSVLFIIVCIYRRTQISKCWIMTHVADDRKTEWKVIFLLLYWFDDNDVIYA